MIGYLSNCKVIKPDFELDASKHPNALLVFTSSRLHFNFHCRSSNMGNWAMPVVALGSILHQKNIENMRNKRGDPVLWLLGGWHFSNFYYGNPQMLKEKYDSFSHQELKNNFKNDESYWSSAVAKGGSKETNTHCEEYSVGMDIPEYVFKRHRRYKALLNDEQLAYAVKQYPPRGEHCGEGCSKYL